MPSIAGLGVIAGTIAFAAALVRASEPDHGEVPTEGLPHRPLTVPEGFVPPEGTHELPIVSFGLTEMFPEQACWLMRSDRYIDGMQVVRVVWDDGAPSLAAAADRLREHHAGSLALLEAQASECEPLFVLDGIAVAVPLHRDAEHNLHKLLLLSVALLGGPERVEAWLVAQLDEAPDSALLRLLRTEFPESAALGALRPGGEGAPSTGVLRTLLAEDATSELHARATLYAGGEGYGTRTRVLADERIPWALRQKVLEHGMGVEGPLSLELRLSRWMPSARLEDLRPMLAIVAADPTLGPSEHHLLEILLDRDDARSRDVLHYLIAQRLLGTAELERALGSRSRPDVLEAMLSARSPATVQLAATLLARRGTPEQLPLLAAAVAYQRSTEVASYERDFTVSLLQDAIAEIRERARAHVGGITMVQAGGGLTEVRDARGQLSAAEPSDD